MFVPPKMNLQIDGSLMISHELIIFFAFLTNILFVSIAFSPPILVGTKIPNLQKDESVE